jgi:ribosomal protein L39E
MEPPGTEFMTPTFHGSPVSSTLRGAVSTRSPTIDHRERLWDRARRNRVAPSAVFLKTKSDLDQKLRATAWRHQGVYS